MVFDAWLFMGCTYLPDGFHSLFFVCVCCMGCGWGVWVWMGTCMPPWTCGGMLCGLEMCGWVHACLHAYTEVCNVGGVGGYMHASVQTHTHGGDSFQGVVLSFHLFLRHSLSCYFWAAYSWLASFLSFQSVLNPLPSSLQEWWWYCRCMPYPI